MIECRELTKSYGNFLAVDGISFSLKRGEVVGLLGPNGAGKSTTIKMVAGYLEPTSGTITLDGTPYGPHSPEIRGQIGYLPESAALYDEMLVYDYLTFEARLRGVKGRESLEEAIRLCALEEAVHKPIRTLSKGYRQRVGLARTLLSETGLVILDEPTSGLDPNQTADVRALVKNIGRERTILFSTHILSEVAAVCDRVIILHRGKIEYDGPIKDEDVERLFRRITQEGKRAEQG
ncbi:MAG: ABC transporter ATP-binding protein [Spirochaetaceae bacterium]